MKSIYSAALDLVEPREKFMERLTADLRLHQIPHWIVADRAGMSANQFSRYVTGKAQPSLETMLRLDEAADLVKYGE